MQVPPMQVHRCTPMKHRLEACRTSTPMQVHMRTPMKHMLERTPDECTHAGAHAHAHETHAAACAPMRVNMRTPMEHHGAPMLVHMC
jgi:hypothetical protein